MIRRFLGHLSIAVEINTILFSDSELKSTIEFHSLLNYTFNLMLTCR